jgi:hypothetical protein
MAIVVDEYDPMKPNDYEECKQKQREKEQHEREVERSQRDKDHDESRYRDRGRDRGDYRSRDRRRRRYGEDDEEPKSLARKGGAAIAPPVSLTAQSNPDDNGLYFVLLPVLFIHSIVKKYNQICANQHRTNPAILSQQANLSQAYLVYLNQMLALTGKCSSHYFSMHLHHTEESEEAV